MDRKILSFANGSVARTTTLNSNIELNSGISYKGYVSRLEDESIYLITNPKNPANEMEIKREDIYSIKIDKNRTSEFFAFGATIGSPGLINLNLGLSIENFGVRVAFGLNSTGNYQINLVYKAYYDKNVEMGFSISKGYFEHTFDYLIRRYVKFSYTGIFFHLNLYGIFVELGTGFESSTLSSPKFLGQVGYIYRFNK